MPDAEAISSTRFTIDSSAITYRACSGVGGIGSHIDEIDLTFKVLPLTAGFVEAR
jgi:hypothetical protein